MKCTKIYYVLLTCKTNKVDTDDDVYTEFSAFVDYMTMDYKLAEKFLKETVRSIRSDREYEERINSESYRTNHYEISYKDGEKRTYDINWRLVNTPEDN